jgi:hypothetical protein
MLEDFFERAASALLIHAAQAEASILHGLGFSINRGVRQAQRLDGWLTGGLLHKRRLECSFWGRAFFWHLYLGTSSCSRVEEEAVQGIALLAVADGVPNLPVPNLVVL